jgi:hypothetical protein
MSRDLAPATETASKAPTIIPVWLVKLEFDSGNFTLSTYDGEIAWNGDVYTGAGAIGSLTQIDEDTELARSTVQMQLRGLPSDIIAIVLGEHFQGRRATTYLGYLDTDNRRLIGDPAIIHRGRMDTAIIDQGSTCAVTLNVESRFAAWDRAKVRRYNDADQQAAYPGDKGMQFVQQAVEGKIWGIR